MELSRDELNAIQGLVTYLNRAFDGSTTSLHASVDIVGEPEGGGPEPRKGRIRVASNEDGILTYAWTDE